MQMVGFGAEYMLTSAVALIVWLLVISLFAFYLKEKKVNEAM